MALGPPARRRRTSTQHHALTYVLVAAVGWPRRRSRRLRHPRQPRLPAKAAREPPRLGVIGPCGNSVLLRTHCRPTAAESAVTSIAEVDREGPGERADDHFRVAKYVAKRGDTRGRPATKDDGSTALITPGSDGRRHKATVRSHLFNPRVVGSSPTGPTVSDCACWLSVTRLLAETLWPRSFSAASIDGCTLLARGGRQQGAISLWLPAIARPPLGGRRTGVGLS